MRANAFVGYCAAAVAVLSGPGAAVWSADAYGPADPVAKDPARFDPRRPIRQEMQMDVPDGFTVGTVGDLIISRPLSQYAARMPGFEAVLEVLHGADGLYGNLETTIFDSRYFSGSPYSWDGDWTNSSDPAVARDLKTMGFAIV